MTESTGPAPDTPAPVTPAPAVERLSRLKMAALVAEIVGAAAVVVSLIFVGIQVQQSNTLARAAAEQRQIEGIQSVGLLMLEYPAVVEAGRRAMAGQPLTPTEREQVVAFMMYLERLQEGLYWQHRNGRIDQELWEAHRRQVRANQASNPLVQAVWEARQEWFTDSYRAFRESDGAGEPLTGRPVVFSAIPAQETAPAAPDVAPQQ